MATDISMISRPMDGQAATTIKRRMYDKGCELQGIKQRMYDKYGWSGCEASTLEMMMTQ